MHAREITERFFELIKKQGVVKLPSHPKKEKANFTSKGREKGRDAERGKNVKHGRRKKGKRWAMT